MRKWKKEKSRIPQFEREEIFVMIELKFGK